MNVLNNMSPVDPFSYSELNFLRQEAQLIYERCLEDGRPDGLEAFIEAYLVERPPRLDLLREILEDLRQRLLALRQREFDVRERMLQMLRDEMGFVPDRLAPDHQQWLEEVFISLRDDKPSARRDDRGTLQGTLATLLQAAAQIEVELEVTEYLNGHLQDWLLGLDAVCARCGWFEYRFDALPEYWQ